MKLIIQSASIYILVFVATVPSALPMDLPQNIASYLQSKRLTEDELLPSLETDGKVFAEYVVTNRAQILNEFATLAPTANKQKLLLAAMEFSGGSDYLATLQKVCDLKAVGTVTPDVFKFAITATQIKRGFLSYNYQNSSVRSLIQRAQTLLIGDVTFKGYLAALLDGSQKAIDRRYFKVEELAEPEILPP